MFGLNPSPQLLLSYVAVVILSLFIIGLGNRFIETISDRTTETHLGGVFVSGLYLGYDLDPDAMIIQEIAGLTVIIESSSILFILTALSVLSILEILFGLLYVWEKRGKIGVFGCGIVMCSGYLFPKVTEVGILSFLFGVIFFIYSEESGF